MKLVRIADQNEAWLNPLGEKITTCAETMVRPAYIDKEAACRLTACLLVGGG